MSQDAIYKRLTEVFRDVFDDDEITPVPTMLSGDVPGWDSLTHIRLVVACEQGFGIRFTTSEVASLSNVGEFATLIARKLAK